MEKWVVCPSTIANKYWLWLCKPDGINYSLGRHSSKFLLYHGLAEFGGIPPED